MTEEVYDVYEDENGNEYIIVDGRRVPFNSSEYELVEVKEGVEEKSEEVSGDEEAYDIFL